MSNRGAGVGNMGWGARIFLFFIVFWSIGIAYLCVLYWVRSLRRKKMSPAETAKPRRPEPAGPVA